MFSTLSKINHICHILEKLIILTCLHFYISPPNCFGGRGSMWESACLSICSIILSMHPSNYCTSIIDLNFTGRLSIWQRCTYCILVMVHGVFTDSLIKFVQVTAGGYSVTRKNFLARSLGVGSCMGIITFSDTPSSCLIKK